MLSFATEFPINPDRKGDDFLNCVKRWILDSPHTVFNEDDLARMSTDPEFNIQKSNQALRSLVAKKGNENFIAFSHQTFDGDIDWRTEIVFTNSGYDAWVSIRTSRESSGPSAKLPAGKKPVVVSALLHSLGGASDGDFPVVTHSHPLSSNDIEIAANFINGTSNYHLPVIYVSCGFNGEYFVDLNSLASDLGGLAHVVVEPNRAFSYRLQIEVSSENAYGGTIGIYWPDLTGRRSFYNIKDYKNKNDMKRAIISDVRSALLNRRPLYNCTWTAVQEIYSKMGLEELKSSGSKNVDDYIIAFDQEINSKDKQIESAETEILRLKSEIKKYEGLSLTTSGVRLRSGAEQEFDAGEFADVVLELLTDSSSRVVSGSRREHILKDILKSNKYSGSAKYKKDKIKELLRNYTSMDSRIRANLVDLGFSITEDGKHYKLIYNNDGRYTFSLSKSSSDHRSGLNTASDISKKLF